MSDKEFEVREIPFQIDVAGIIEILGKSLYSREDTAVRELLQNAHDAIHRRRARELTFQGKIRIYQDPARNTLAIEDDGVGLSIGEAEAYLGTLGRGITGLLKRQSVEATSRDAGADDLIGQFGIGLFSAFLVADRVVVESKKGDEETSVRWEAGTEATIKLSGGPERPVGTRVTLHLKRSCERWSREESVITEAVTRYADFLPIAIHLEDASRRMNIVSPSFFDPTPDPDLVAMELEERFSDSALDVLVVREDRPIAMKGALFISRHRTPGFSERPHVSVTVRRMVISNQIDDLLPSWAVFYRGVLELPGLSPTTSREDLIRDAAFESTKRRLDELLLARFRELQGNDPARFESIIAWHRYHLAGAALDHASLRAILTDAYLFQTSVGPLSFREILRRSRIDGDGETRVWMNGDRGQEVFLRQVFVDSGALCVHSTRTFEPTLLAAMAQDETTADHTIRVLAAHVSEDEFLWRILGMSDLGELPPEWEAAFSKFDVSMKVGSLASPQPVLVFSNRQNELRRDFDKMRRSGTLPATFARLVDSHLGDVDEDSSDRVILNQNHELIRRALQNGPEANGIALLRTLVSHAMQSAGLPRGLEMERIVAADLIRLAESLPAE